MVENECKYNRCKVIPGVGIMHCHEYPECREVDSESTFPLNKWEMILYYIVILFGFGTVILEDLNLIDRNPGIRTVRLWLVCSFGVYLIIKYLFLSYQEMRYKRVYQD